jgi:hypothetical protein
MSAMSTALPRTKAAMVTDQNAPTEISGSPQHQGSNEINDVQRNKEKQRRRNHLNDFLFDLGRYSVHCEWLMITAGRGQYRLYRGPTFSCRAPP